LLLLFRPSPLPAIPLSLSHGQPGFRSGLGRFVDLIDSSSWTRVELLELLMAKVLASGSWTLHSGSIYKQAVAYTHDGVVRSVASVVCSMSPFTLSRVEAIADVVAGCWYYDDDAAAPEAYLRLPDSSNPSGAVVAALFLFTFATKGIVHPSLGPNKLNDGGLETWTTSVDLTNWTENVSGSNWTFARAPAIAPTGLYSAKFSALDVTSGVQQVSQVQNGLVVGKGYRLSGVYQTSQVYRNLQARLFVGEGASNYLSQDGRNVDITDLPTLQPTQGETRGFSFDFIAHHTTPALMVELGWISGVGLGDLLIDDLRLQRIYRFHFYDPRLAADSIPEVGLAMARLGFGGKTVGVGTAKLINQDGALEQAFGELVPVSAVVAVGGEFPDGQTIPREDCRVSYPGTVMDVDGDDREISMRLEALTFLRTVLPLNQYKLSEFPLMELNREGYGRPIAFGRGNFGGPVLRYMIPTRIGIDATTQYGEYELLDTSNAPNGIPQITVHTFLTQEDRGQAQ
jgi:hypothetical protein